MNNKVNLPVDAMMASSVHDIKNIIGAILESNDFIYSKLSAINFEHKDEIAKSSQLLAKINQELMQLLCFFKFDNGQYKLQIRDQDVDSFLCMQKAFAASLIFQKGIEVEVELDEEIEWFFDETLLASAIRNAIMNAIKFAKSKIVLSASVEDKQLKVNVEDDGTGVPEEMLGEVTDTQSAMNVDSMSTGLGLYFAKTVASLHKNKDAIGKVVFSKSDKLGGACLSIYIP